MYINTDIFNVFGDVLYPENLVLFTANIAEVDRFTGHATIENVVGLDPSLEEYVPENIPIFYHCQYYKDIVTEETAAARYEEMLQTSHLAFFENDLVFCVLYVTDASEEIDDFCYITTHVGKDELVQCARELLEISIVRLDHLVSGTTILYDCVTLYDPTTDSVVTIEDESFEFPVTAGNPAWITWRDSNLVDIPFDESELWTQRRVERLSFSSQQEVTVGSHSWYSGTSQVCGGAGAPFPYTNVESYTYVPTANPVDSVRHTLARGGSIIDLTGISGFNGDGAGPEAPSYPSPGNEEHTVAHTYSSFGSAGYTDNIAHTDGYTNASVNYQGLYVMRVYEFSGWLETHNYETAAGDYTSDSRTYGDRSRIYVVNDEYVHDMIYQSKTLIESSDGSFTDYDWFTYSPPPIPGYPGWLDTPPQTWGGDACMPWVSQSKTYTNDSGRVSYENTASWADVAYATLEVVETSFFKLQTDYAFSYPNNTPTATYWYEAEKDLDGQNLIINNERLTCGITGVYGVACTYHLKSTEVTQLGPESGGYPTPTPSDTVYNFNDYDVYVDNTVMFFTGERFSSKAEISENMSDIPHNIKIGLTQVVRTLVDFWHENMVLRYASESPAGHEHVSTMRANIELSAKYLVDTTLIGD
jgi:hypothetical protein